MKKLLILIGALIMCDAYGATEDVAWIASPNAASYSTTSCTTGDNITEPTITPTLSGYRFIGWKESTSLAEYTLIDGTSSTPASTGTSSTNWTTSFLYGKVSGTRRCSSTNGSCGANYVNCTTNSNPSTSGDAKYCWCKLTDAGPLSGLINVSSSAWVFNGIYSTTSSCTTNCGFYCGYRVQSLLNFRRTVFGLN